MRQRPWLGPWWAVLCQGHGCEDVRKMSWEEAQGQTSSEGEPDAADCDISDISAMPLGKSPLWGLECSAGLSKARFGCRRGVAKPSGGVSCVVFLQDNDKGNGSRRGTEFMHVRKLWMKTRLL